MVGNYDCTVVEIQADAATIQSFLPAELLLGDQKATHPVLVLFGRQTGVAASISPRFPTMDYFEAAIIVPFVYRRQGQYRGPFLHTVKIFLDLPASSLGGVLLYGFPKAVARFDVGSGSFAVLSASERPVLSAAHSDRAGSLTTAELSHVVRTMQQPSVSLHPAAGLIGSGFWWNFGGAVVTPASVAMSISANVIAKFPAAATAVVADGVCVGRSVNSWRIQTRWRLTRPLSLNRDWSPWNGVRT